MYSKVNLKNAFSHTRLLCLKIKEEVNITMLRKIFLILSLCIFLCFPIYSNLSAQNNPSNYSAETRCAQFLGSFPQDISPQGIKIEKGYVCSMSRPVRVGSTIRVRFTLLNISNSAITFDSNGVFVGTRWNSTTDANNRDFGHQYRNYTLPSKGSITLEANIVVDRPGTWRFWPAYHINGRYGPFRWHEVVVEVAP